MTNLGPIPRELLLAHERWTARGRPAQPAPHCFPHRWTARLPEHGEFIEALPNPISREAVAAQFVDADDSEQAALRAFLAAMIWGHGRNGYGAYRTAGVLAASDHAGEWLSEALQTTRTAGGPAGFEFLARHRLKGLGVAFATKYLYFCLAPDADVPPAPILDRIVRDWLATHLDWQPRLDWRIDDYKRYCDLVVQWSHQLNEPAGTVEYLMFASGIGTASQWADSSERVTQPTATSNSATTAVLAALDDAADAFEALTGDITSEDAEDFERGLRALKRIIIAQTSH